MARNLHELISCGLNALARPVAILHKAGPPAVAARQAASSSAEAPRAVLCDGGDTHQDKPLHLLAGQELPLLADGRGLTCLSYNVLLPNSVDGWWIYKYYRDPSEAHTCWVARRTLLKEQILKAQADVVCLQETSELSFVEDFDFMVQAGYQALMHEKKGRMRPATFWRKDRWQSFAAQHKDRSLVVGLRKLCGPDAGATVFVVNVHLAAGPSADRRLRQVHEALDSVNKEVKKAGLEPKRVPVLVCGDFNSQGHSAVRELLTVGEVGPDFREGGDPTERGQEEKQITSKVKQHSLGCFADAAEVAFTGSKVPATILATNIDSKMLNEDGSTTPALDKALSAAFESCCSAGRTRMVKEDMDRFLLRINRKLGRGSEEKFVQAALERSGEDTFSHEDFHALYAQELAEGKFWGVEHDLGVLLGKGLAVPPDGPCELRFDYVYFSEASLQLQAVWDPLTDEQKSKIWGPPFEVLPNLGHPSDHLPVTAAFTFR